MKVLWFSNIPLTEEKLSGTGTWLYSMSRLLVKNGIDIYNITQGNCKGGEYHELDSIKEWRIQRAKKIKNHLPGKETLDLIIEIVESIKPDIFHVWGMEEYWGLLFSRGVLKGRVVLDIQGIKYACADIYYGSMGIKDVISSIGAKELLMPGRSIVRNRQLFEKWGVIESEILSSINHISVQSDWVYAHIKPYISKSANIYRTKIFLRPEFEVATQWAYKQNESPTIVTIFNQQPFKGFYILLKALSIIKVSYPNVKLKVIGNYYNPTSSLRRPGFISYLNKLLKEYGIEDNVVFLGAMDAGQIIKTMQSSHVMAQTSFCESYSMALAESMAVGIPCVVAYAGAMPELAKDKIEALFYPPFDPYCCASLIERVFEDKDFAEFLSDNARIASKRRNVPGEIVNTQIDIYNQVISSPVL